MPVPTPQELLNTPCPGCGATLPIAPELEQVSCDHCAAEFAVPAALRARAREYLARIRGAWADEVEARWIALLHGSAARTNPSTLRWLGVLSLSAPLWIILLASGAVEILSPFLVAGLVLITLYAAARIASNITGPARAPTVALAIGASLGACGVCGGPVPFEEGETACRCRFCGATSVPTPEQKQQMVASALRRVAPAQAVSAEAVAENWRTATEASAVFGAFGKRNAASILSAILIAGGFALTAFAIYVVMVMRRPGVPRHDASWVLPALGVGFVAVVAHGVLKVRRLNAARAEFERVLGRPLRAHARR
jgi:hypothetical protein